MFRGIGGPGQGPSHSEWCHEGQGRGPKEQVGHGTDGSAFLGLGRARSGDFHGVVAKNAKFL